MKFYNQIDDKLKPYINHYWTTAGEWEEETALKILPMDHMDLVMPLKGDRVIFYRNKKKVEAPALYFHGMRDVAVHIEQKGYVECFGISFKSYGFYPFIKKDLSSFINQTVDFSIENEELANDMIVTIGGIKSVDDEASILETIRSLELLLIDTVRAFKYDANYDLVSKLCESNGFDPATVAQASHISIRTLERIFNRYVGISPKLFTKIKQFEAASRPVLYENEMKLTDIAYQADYYDQAHFTKSFKKYSEETPKGIRKTKKALKSRMSYESDL